MNYFSIVVLLSALIVSPLPAAAGERLTPRPLDPIAADAFDRAVARSARVRSLVATLAASHVIVHIETTRLMPAGISGTTRFVISRGGYRYVRISIDAELPRGTRAAILGHELQHACEVAESSADDARSMRELFENEGHRAGPYFETLGAIQTQRRVYNELKFSRSLQAEPVAKFDH